MNHDDHRKSTTPGNGFDDKDQDDAQFPKALPDADEPPNESATQSLGRSISQIVTGGTHENKVEPQPADGPPKGR